MLRRSRQNPSRKKVKLRDVTRQVQASVRRQFPKGVPKKKKPSLRYLSERGFNLQTTNQFFRSLERRTANPSQWFQYNKRYGGHTKDYDELTTKQKEKVTTGAREIERLSRKEDKSVEEKRRLSSWLHSFGYHQIPEKLYNELFG